MTSEKWTEYTDRKAEEWRAKFSSVERIFPAMIRDFVKDVMPGMRYKKANQWDRQVINEYNVVVLKARTNYQLVEAIFEHITGPEGSQEVRSVNPLQYIRERKYILQTRIQQAVTEFNTQTGVIPRIMVDEDGSVRVEVDLTI